jgi:hypothetical protein
MRRRAADRRTWHQFFRLRFRRLVLNARLSPRRSQGDIRRQGLYRRRLSFLTFLGSFDRFGMFAIGNLMTEEPPQFESDIFVDRAGVGLLLRYAQFGKLVQDLMRFDFQLPSQLINANLLLHKYKTVVSRKRT